MKNQPDALFQYAVGLLTRREHSRHELLLKIRQKFSSVDAPAETKVLERLEDLGYQSDERYVEMVVKARTNRGYGPRYIRQYIETRGVSRDLIAAALEPYAYEWLELANQTLTKRYNSAQVHENRAKCIRFLLGRGYDPDIARKAVEESLKNYHEESHIN